MTPNEPIPAPLPASRGVTSHPAYRVFLVALLAVAAVTSAALVSAGRPGPQEPPRADEEPAAPPSKELKEYAAKYFPSWPANRTPELVILMTGQQHNYEAPCGCTEPQFGGLERRHNFFTQLRGFGLKTVAVDLGDIYYPGKLTDQAKLKYQTSMKALAAMGYDAIAIGLEEFRVPLLEALANTVLQNKYPYGMLAANIENKDEYPSLNSGSMIEDFRVVEPKGARVKVGVVGTIGQSVVDKINKLDSSMKFKSNSDAIPAALAAMKAKDPGVRVLLYQGTEDEAKVLAQNIDEFDVILTLSSDSEPRTQVAFADPLPGKEQKPKAQIVQVGHKGRYVGVMGVFRGPEGKLEYRWELVPLGVEFKTPADKQAANPGVQLLEAYTKELKDKDFLSRYPQALLPLQVVHEKKRFHPQFIGSSRCKTCHESEYEVWDTSRHANAFPTLSEHPKAKPPHNRQFDGECVVCHTTGFGYQTGYRDEKRTPHLFGVGCETCHGPGSMHADEPGNKDHRLALSPWKADPKDYLTAKAVEEKEPSIPVAERAVADKVFRLCIQCHDTDNDHNFKLEKWHIIGHGKGPTVKKK